MSDNTTFKKGKFYILDNNMIVLCTGKGGQFDRFSGILVQLSTDLKENRGRQLGYTSNSWRKNWFVEIDLTEEQKKGLLKLANL